VLRGERSTGKLPAQPLSPCERLVGELRLLPVLPARGSGPVFFAGWARLDLRTALDFIVCLFCEACLHGRWPQRSSPRERWQADRESALYSRLPIVASPSMDSLSGTVVLMSTLLR
jgi:hypothetical protein